MCHVFRYDANGISALHVSCPISCLRHVHVAVVCSVQCNLLDPCLVYGGWGKISVKEASSCVNLLGFENFTGVNKSIE